MGILEWSWSVYKIPPDDNNKVENCRQGYYKAIKLKIHPYKVI